MNENSLAIFTKASQMLAEATTIQKAKELKDLSLTAADWAKRKNMGNDAIQYCRAYALEAERKMGMLLKETPRNVGAKGVIISGNERVPVMDNTPTLADLGITKNESSRAQFLAGLPTETFNEIRGGELTIPEVKRVIRRRERVENIVAVSENVAPLESLDICYPVLYVDPPWRYEHSKTDNRKIENQYPTMDLDDIKALPVVNVSTPDAVLFLWATSPKLKEAMDVIECWGFTYRTCFVWVKDKIGMGYYARQQHELLLIAAKGNLPVPEPENRVSSVINSPRLEHSQKPTIVYEIIEAMYPEYNKLEMFSRNPRNGWDAWGNQC